MSYRLRNPIVGFLVRFLVVFVLFCLPWPGVSGAYATAYRLAGNVFFSSFGAHGEARFEPLTQPDPERDTLVRLTNRLTGGTADFGGSSRTQGYQPTVFLLSLILATPMELRRRVRALMIGLILVHLFVGLRMCIFLLDAASGSEQTAFVLFHPGAVGRVILDFAGWVVVYSFAGSYFLPLPIWLLACFGRQDWNRWINTGWKNVEPSSDSQETN